MVEKNSQNLNEESAKDRNCPDCNDLMAKGYIFTNGYGYNADILYIETSPDEEQGFWRKNPKPILKIGKGRYSSVPVYFCKHCEVLLVDQEFTYFTYQKSPTFGYEKGKLEAWPDIDAIREKYRTHECPKCENSITNENFCPSCGFDLKPSQEAM